MRGSSNDLVIAYQVAGATFRQVEWGGMSLELANSGQAFNAAPLLKGLPDDCCQCPHWGYVVKGQLTYIFSNRTEQFKGGDLYYVPAGHQLQIAAHTEYVEISPKEQLQQTIEVIELNCNLLPKGGTN